MCVTVKSVSWQLLASLKGVKVVHYKILFYFSAITTVIVFVIYMYQYMSRFKQLKLSVRIALKSAFVSKKYLGLKPMLKIERLLFNFALEYASLITQIASKVLAVRLMELLRTPLRLRYQSLSDLRKHVTYCHVTDIPISEWKLFWKYW